MRERLQAIWGALLVSTLALILGACGSAHSPAAVMKLTVKSPVVAGEALPARYTCDGQNVSPPLEWGWVPPDVKELALFVVGFTPKHAHDTYRLSVEWAVGGLNPSLHRLAVGEVPPGAFLGFASGRRRQRYSICPAKGTSVHYQVELYAVPSSLQVAQRFSGHALLNALTVPRGRTRSLAHGGFVADYTRE